MLIPPDEAEHFLRVYQAAMARAAVAAKLKGLPGFAEMRQTLYQPKHRRNPPTDDAGLLAALETAVYGDFIVGRHRKRGTEMIGPGEQVYLVHGLTTELGEILPPWVYVKTAVMQFRGRWICDGLLEGGNILIGPNMIRELTETIRKAKPAAAPAPTAKTAGARKAGATRRETAPPKESKAREERITMEIVVDAYDASERAMGWYCSLADRLSFPFRARCVDERPISPLAAGDAVEVTAMAPSEECEHEMFVEIRWQKRRLAVPLDQLEILTGDRSTKQAVADWHYWVGRGYRF